MDSEIQPIPRAHGALEPEAVPPAMLRLKAVFEECFATTFENFVPEISPRTLKKWDSKAQIRLILAVEEAFAIEFQPEEMGEMKNVAAFCSKIEKKLKDAATS